MVVLEYDASSSRLILTVEKRLDFCDFRLAWVSFLREHPNVRLDSAIWDLTRLDSDAILEGDLQRMTRAMAGMGRAINLAVVVPAQAMAGLAQTYLGGLVEEMDSFRVFRSMAAAGQWLDRQRNDKHRVSKA